jgi:Peptidase family C25/Propeptide_C25
MPRTMSRVLGIAVLVVLLLLPASGGSGALGAKKKKGHPLGSSLQALVLRTNGLPGKALPTRKLRALRRTAIHARRVARQRPCAAVRDLSRYRRILTRVRARKGKRPGKAATRAAALTSLSLRASSLLLASKRTRRCGGGARPSRLAHAKTKILMSNARGMKLRLLLPAVQFVPRTGGGKTWTQLVLPNTDAPGKPGTPGIPVVSKILGIPDGAKLIVKPGKTRSYTLDGVKVFPAQPESADAVSKAPNFNKPPFATKPFTLDPKAYLSKKLQPPEPADGEMLGDARDLKVGDLTVPAVQYNARRSKLKVLTSVDIQVLFKGGPHTFSDELDSPWEQPQRRLAADMLNASVIKTPLEFVLRKCGMEMLVITNHATRTAADTLAKARNADGLRTTVVETGGGAAQAGTTPAQIQTYIRARLTDPKCIHPSYIAIMGDDELVPTFEGINGIPSDLGYSLRDNADELPDVGVGRVLGADQDQVGTEVAKIIGYEAAPPGGASFLNHATVAAQFQDDEHTGQESRTFIEFAETVRKGLAGRGVTVDRVYHDSPTTDPQKFNDGTSLPAALKKPTFPWDGTGADVSTAWNAGRFLVIHRDHGWSDGWGTPNFTTDNVNALTNGSLLPVVMSVNCSSAAYDYDEDSFTQSALVKPDGGAVGVFGDTRDSPSWHNSQIALGFVDALLPSVLPSEGPAFKQRMADALINGKLRLAGLSPPGSDGNTRNELYLWHYFGDPSMQMWGGGKPLFLDPGQFKAVLVEQFQLPIPIPDPPPFGVQVSLPKGLAGQPISLLQNGEVIGKAIAGDGVATIPASFGDGSVKPGELQVALEADGSPPVSVPVDGVPKAKTTLQQSCPRSGAIETPLTVTGALSGAPAGSSVDVTFTPPKGEGSAAVVHAKTGADGSWQASVTPTANQPGTWSISSSYAGTAQYAGSSAGPCTVLVSAPIP